MDKAKTSGKQKKSSRTSKKMVLMKHDTADAGFKDPKKIKTILIEALMEDDLETFRDVLIAHIRAMSKTQLSARSKLGRQTLYDLIDEDKEFNPTLSTLGSILKAIAA